MINTPNRLGDYRLIRHIRSGASTEIYHALQLDNQQKRVLKVLSSKALDNREKVQQLRHEYQVAGHLDHRNVLKIIEYSKHGAYAWIALEQFAGHSLRQMLSEKQRDALLERLPQLAEQMCQALWHLHQHGWAHCSVKPANFLINPQFDLKLIDFSLARRIQQNKFQFWMGKHRSIGSPTYMAPEQVRRQSVDQRADIYSLGCTLFELIEGRVPYTGTSQNELLNKHLSARVPRITSRSQHVTPAIAQLVEAMMAKDPEHRPENMLRVHQTFQRAFSQSISLSHSGAPATNDSAGSFEISQASSSTSPTMQPVPAIRQRYPKKANARAGWREIFKKTSVRCLRWRWLQVAVLVVSLAIPIGLWWWPENDAVERQVLQRFGQLATAMEHPPEFASQAERQQYWQQLKRDVQAGVASAQQQLPMGTAARPDRLELHWSANLLPRVLPEHNSSTTELPLMAILKEHLDNAEEYLNRREEQRSVRSLELSKTINGPTVFWMLVVVDVIGAAMLLRLFLRKSKAEQS